MARPFRYQYPGANYHITARGNERSSIFRDDRDRTRFLEKLEEQVAVHGVLLYAWCLMSNHYHLVVCTPRANLSAFMHQLNTSYTVWFNARHRRCGHLLAGRFKGKLVEGGSYLLRLTRYVHLNPVKIRSFRRLPLSEKAQILSRYRWSSFREYAGLTPVAPWLDRIALSAYGELETAAAQKAYRQFVEEKLDEGDDEFDSWLRLSSRALGSEDFRVQIEDRLRTLREAAPNAARWVDISRRRVEAGPSPDTVTAVVLAEYGIEAALLLQRGNREPKDVWMTLLIERCGLTARELGQMVGHSDGGTVGRRVREFAKLCRDTPSIQARKRKVEARITNSKA